MLLHTKVGRYIGQHSSLRMVADILIPPTLNEKSRNVQPVSPQPQPHNNNNLSLLVDRESSILKLNRFEFGII